jgi:type II pantothenate kinase
MYDVNKKSSMKVGIDFGISFTDLSILDESKPKFISFDSKELSVSSISKQIHKLVNFDDVEFIGVTGGKHYDLPSKIGGIELSHANEIDAISKGTNYLAKNDKKKLIISSGSGTAFVLSDGSMISHAGGTGVGGGTIVGLCNLINGENNPDVINKLANRGKVEKVDLLLNEVVSGPIGELPKDATAVNFGKVRYKNKSTKADKTAAIMNLVGQTVARMASATAVAFNCDNVYVVGRTPQYDLYKSVLKRWISFAGLSADFLNNGEFASSLGTLID